MERGASDAGEPRQPGDRPPARAHEPPTAGQRWALAGIALAAALAFARAAARSLWIDDIYRTFSTWVAPERWWSWVLADAHNPLYNVAMRGWIHLVGDGTLAIRLPSIVAAWATAWLLWAWAQRRFGGWIAVGAVGVFLLNPMLVLHATMAKNNAWTILLALASMASIDHLRARPTHARHALVLVLTTLALYTDWAVLLLIAPAWIMLIGAAVRRDASGRRLDPRLVAVVIGLPVALVLPLAIHKLGHPQSFQRAYLRHFDLVELWHLLFNWLLWGNALVPSPDQRHLIAGLGAGLGLPLVVGGVARLVRTAPGRLVVACLVLPLAGLLAISAVLAAPYPGGEHFLYQERNLLPLLPVLAIVLAAGGAALRDGAPGWFRSEARARRWLMRAGPALVGLLVAASGAGNALMWTMHADATPPSWPRADFRGMAREVEARAGRAVRREVVPTLVVSVPLAMPLRYYLRGEMEELDLEIRHPQRPTTRQDIERLMRRTGAGRVLVLVETPLQGPEWIDRPGIERGWRMREVASFGGLALYRLTRRGGGG